MADLELGSKDLLIVGINHLHNLLYNARACGGTAPTITSHTVQGVVRMRVKTAPEIACK